MGFIDHRVIINDCLDNGTQLPYIKRAKEEGYGILVTNTNLNRDEFWSSIRVRHSASALRLSK